jgi:tetratricopeptide (TPR) repeat protein
MPIVSLGLTRDDEALGNACALWLKLMLEGAQGASQTESWLTIFRAGGEQGIPDGRIPLTGLKLLGKSTGLTHAVVTRLTGNPGRLILSAQVYSLATARPCGKALAIGVTQSEIVHQLPLLATHLASLLGVDGRHPIVTQRVAATLSEFKSLGSLPFRFDARAYRSLLPQLIPVAMHEPLAGVLLLADAGSSRHIPALRPVATALSHMEPGNLLAIDLLSRFTWGWAQRELAPVTKILGSNANCAIMTEVIARDYAHFCKGPLQVVDAQSAEELAARLVRLSPRSPVAHRFAALVCMRTGERLNDEHSQQKAIGSTITRQTEENLFDLAYTYDLEAVQLDPQYVAAWRLMIAVAAVDGRMSSATHAVSVAEQMAPYDPRIYARAIELYGERHMANGNDLIAATTHYAALVSSPYLQFNAVSALRQCRLVSESGGLLRSLLESNRNWRKTSGQNIAATLRLALLEMLSFQTDSARKHFHDVLHQDPHNSGALAGLGTLAYRCRNVSKTANYLDEAIALDPGQYRLYSMAAWAAFQLGHTAIARVLLTTSLENLPSDALGLSLVRRYGVRGALVAIPSLNLRNLVKV